MTDHTHTGALQNLVSLCGVVVLLTTFRHYDWYGDLIVLWEAVSPGSTLEYQVKLHGGVYYLVVTSL